MDRFGEYRYEVRGIVGVDILKDHGLENAGVHSACVHSLSSRNDSSDLEPVRARVDVFDSLEKIWILSRELLIQDEISIRRMTGY